MNKFIALCFILFTVLLLPQPVSAHTDLKKSTPANGDTVTAALGEIKLSFATEIQPLVVLTVTDASKKEVPVKIETGKDNMTGVFDAPLADGTYTVNWRIIGEDGHNIKGEYSFTVALPKEPTPAPDDTTTSENAPDATNAGNTSTSLNNSPEQTPTSESNSNTADAETTSNTTNTATDTSVADDQATDTVLPEGYANAADTGAAQHKTWTAIIAVAVLVVVFLFFRKVIKQK
ncbi:copper resistance protein CopC [Paenibacillus sp. OV219]|uniref:copper resistance CopC family protein n=1 Tax=Paenibacillus sp. OV219 TaxID=1884377 RepID=UPI0008CC1609|nr:copper resistance protein CopC [Paenibacillus sp. OV219]SEN96726.1 hypothetical protein SAMN05518847_10597 [Paenibacillus sp. OV219]